MKLSKTEILMALAVPMIWGMGIVITKDAIAAFPPILLMSMRFTLTALVMIWFVPIPRKNLFQLFLIAIVAAAIQYSLTFTGLKGLDAGIAALVVQLEVPFLVILGVFMLKEKPSLQKWFGIAIAFIGVGFIAERINASGSLSSILLVIGGAFSWALGQVFVRKLKDINGVTVTAWIAVFAAPQLLLMSFLFEDDQALAVQNAEPIVWAAVVYLGLIMTALGYYFWNTLIRAHDVGRVAPFLLLLPVFAVIGGTLFLGEDLSISKIFGGGIVILGVALITFERS